MIVHVWKYRAFYTGLAYTVLEILVNFSPLFGVTFTRHDASYLSVAGLFILLLFEKAHNTMRSKA